MIKGIILFLTSLSIIVVCLLSFDKKINSIEEIIKTNDVIVYNNTDLRNLKGKTILLNTYNITDLINVFSLDLAEKTQNLYKNKLIVVDIINNSEGYSQDIIKKFIIKNNIKRLVLVVNNNEYGNNNFLTLINSRGTIKGIYHNGDEEKLFQDINLLKLKNNKGKISLNLLKETVAEPFIKSLSYIKYWNNYFVIVDGSGKNINFISKQGKIDKIFSNFCRPSGIDVKDNEIYVADICDNSIKVIDIETGKISKFIEVEKPLAIAFLNEDLIISTSENILRYRDNSIDVICENCNNVFKLSKYNKNLYFIHNGHIKFIDEDYFVNDVVDIDNNILLNVDETGIYLADKKNNRILRFNNNKYEVYSDDIYDFPTDIVDYKDKLYITNENESNIILLDRITKNFEKISIDFSKDYNSELDEFLNANNQKSLKINNKTNIVLNLKDGYRLQKYAPQSIELFEENKNNHTAILIKKYAINDLEKAIELPELKNNKVYYININLFYKKEDGRLLIKKDTLKLISDKMSTNNNLEINFLYE